MLYPSSKRRMRGAKMFTNINSKPIILVGKMGSGKNSVANYLLTGLSDDSCKYARIKTYTTRARRDGEEPDAYHFVTNEEFDEMKENGEFAEFYETEKLCPGFALGQSGEVVKRSERVQYGSLKKDYVSERDMNPPVTVRIVILDPDGAKKAIKMLGVQNCNVIYLKAAEETLKKRCLTRGTEDVEEIERRLRDEREKFEKFEHYTDLTINCDNTDVEGVAQIINRYVHYELY